MAGAKSKTVKRKPRDETGWQAQKSAMTRETILDAAVDCFINIGYANTTTARIAEQAKVSRGAMLHHFASKSELIQAAVEHLRIRLVALYERNIRSITQKNLPVDERNRRGLQGYWKYLKSDLFVAYHELCVAGRTDPELQQILEASVSEHDKRMEDANRALFPEWSELGELFQFAIDLTRFTMEGMAVSLVVRERDKRIKRMIDYLGDRLEEIFHSRDKDAAIHRHFNTR